MQKIKILVIPSILLALVLSVIAGGFHLGLPSAVKHMSKQLDNKVRSNSKNQSQSWSIFDWVPPDVPLPATGTVTFSYAPLQENEYNWIYPLGHLRPPDHTIPTDHHYFELVDTNPYCNVIAPADGYIFLIQKFADYDFQIYIAFTKTFIAYFDHLSEIEQSILSQAQFEWNMSRVPIKVKAGDILGKSGGGGSAALDFGAYNKETILSGLIHPERYGDMKYTVSPLLFYQEPLRTTLLNRVVRSSEPIVGKIDYDKPGTLAGTWFSEGTPFYWDGSFDLGAHCISFVHGSFKPEYIMISIGDKSIFSFGVYTVQPDAPDPENVSASSGKITYKLYPVEDSPYSPGPHYENPPDGTLLVQVIDDNKIKIEANVSDFDQNAKYYYR